MGWVPTLLATLPGPFHPAPAAPAKPQGAAVSAGVAVPGQPVPPAEVCLEQEPPFRVEARVGPAGTPACPTSVCPPRFAYKDEYEKFKLYLTIILIVISFTCRFLLNSRWVRCSGLGPRPPPGSGTNPVSPPQGDRRRLQLPAGLVLLHADHPREHPHQQRLPVGEGARRALELPGEGVRAPGPREAGTGPGCCFLPASALLPVPEHQSWGLRGQE